MILSAYWKSCCVCFKSLELLSSLHKWYYCTVVFLSHIIVYFFYITTACCSQVEHWQSEDPQLKFYFGQKVFSHASGIALGLTALVFLLVGQSTILVQAEISRQLLDRLHCDFVQTFVFLRRYISIAGSYQVLANLMIFPSAVLFVNLSN